MRKLRMIGATIGALILASMVMASPAQATEPAYITASAEKSCGQVVITFTNTTAHTYSADVRAMELPDGEWSAGTDDEWTGQNISGGPFDGEPFGQRYNPVTLPAGETVTHTVTFDEDSGEHRVQYRVWRGPENDYYLDWKKVDVGSDCKAAEPTTEPTAEPTTEPTTEPSASMPAAPSSPAPGAGGGLPVTGVAAGGIAAGAVVLLGVGGVLFFAARRRRVTFTP